MSQRYTGNDYRQDRRSPPPWRDRQQDRRASYNTEPPRRGRELRDAPPLGRGGPYREPRDFSPRDLRDEIPRQRRNSRDAPLAAGPTYSDPPPFRGGFGRGRGRGDSDFRGGRGGRGRPFDDRDFVPRDRSRDRSPPRIYRGDTRDDRSPDRRMDDRPSFRREDPRWNDRERDLDRRRPEPPLRQDTRQLDDTPSSALSTTVPINPQRAALIEESIVDRRSSIIPPPVRREPPEIPAYMSGRAENTNNRYPRASSPPAQPPPVPAFGFNFTAPPVAPKPVPESRTSVQLNTSTSLDTSRPTSSGADVRRSPKISASRPASFAEPPPAAPRAPRAESDAPPIPRSQTNRPWETQHAVVGLDGTSRSVSPNIHPSSRPIAIPPTGPRAERTPSQPSTSPRLSFSALNRDINASTTIPRPRSPPHAAPSGPRMSTSPGITFATAPIAPKASRIPPTRRGPSGGPGIRPIEKPAPPINRMQPIQQPAPKPAGWNQWRRDTQPDDLTSRQINERPANAEPNVRASAEDRMDIDAQQGIKAAATVEHSAKQSFLGKPDNEMPDQDLSDAVDDASSSTEDEIEDPVLFEARFDRDRRQLEAKLVDLSLRKYRATTPLENIARLTRITMKDVQRYNEREQEMDVDEPAEDKQSVLPPTHSSESEEAVDLMTPRGEEDTSVLIHDADEAEEIIKRIRPITPELIHLPFMMKDAQPILHETTEYKQRIVFQQEVQHEVEAEIIKEQQLAQQDNEDLAALFAQLYQNWRVQSQIYDHEREEAERIERQASFEPGPEPESVLAATPALAMEHRRPHRFSSQLDVERVLKESEETARLEQERADREARKVQADMEKEAIIPDQMTETELRQSTFVDNNRLREPESLTMVFTYEPAPDNFTEQEQQIFISAFKETPKKWSEIASLLPGREPKDCIRHYYANKWDGRFRDTRTRKLKNKKPRGKQGARGKGSAMADLARADEQLVPMSESGRPRRAAAPASFVDGSAENKQPLAGQSPAKRSGPGSGKEQDGEKPSKRRRAVGDKPGRKPKTTQPLASLAAAPLLSPDERPPQSAQAKDFFERSRLEDANLLAGLANVRPQMQPEQVMFATQDSYMRGSLDDRMRAPMQSSSVKPSPSSYWSVPEQTDFNKYIKHFGTDFHAIATHMGTKTQTMIKNHYQRQIDGGNRPDLEADAQAANMRRERGENIGAPPVPTPITKRKYDQPTTSTQRALVSHTDAMDIDDGRPRLKHGSPPQYPMQPRFPPNPQPGRVVESSATPVPASATPASRPYNSRMSIFPDGRSESRPVSAFLQHAATPTRQSAQPSRSVQEPPDPAFIQGLLEEQSRALYLQGQGQGHYPGPERVDNHRSSIQHGSQRSPALQAVHMQSERRAIEPRSNSPPSGFFQSKAQASARSFDAMRYPQHTRAPSPPPRREESRTSIGSAPVPPVPPVSQPAEQPRRSNVMSLLNDTPEEPMPKRSSMDLPANAIPRHGSPAQLGTITQPYASMPPSRMDSYGSAGGSQSHYSRPSIAGPAVSSSLKQESLSASSSAMAPKQEWPRSTHGTHTPPAGPQYDRNGRSYYSHPSGMLGQLGANNRPNPSPPPPPHASLAHGRTPSLPTVDAHRSAYPPPTTGQHQSGLYAQHPPPPFSQAPPSTLGPSHDHLTHSTLGGQYAPVHQRAASRDDRPPFYFDRQRERERERPERDWREEEERMRAEIQMAEQRRYEDRQYGRSRPPLQSGHSAGFGMYESAHSRQESSMNMREQSIREAHMAMQHEEERLRHRQQFDERESEAQARDAARRRHDDAYMPGARRTPLGGGFGAPAMPPSRR